MNLPTYAVAALLVFVVFPALWPFLWLRLLSTRTFSTYFVRPIKRPWDYVFSKRKPCWMIVHLKDQRRIGGVFDSSSYASSYPADPQIYIQEVWKLDDEGRFIEPVERSEGIIVLKEDIVAVELFSYTDE
jgi:hypothetical protein